jgi:hypothetical protein
VLDCAASAMHGMKNKPPTRVAMSGALAARSICDIPL